MKKGILLLLLPIFSYTQALAQSGIGTTAPHADAVLEIKSADKGVLIPRIALASTTSPDPLSADVAGMLVYNTASDGTAPNEVIPGFYYNDGTQVGKIGRSD